MKILVSIPVHESPDCVKNQIENARKFMPDHQCYFMVHVSGDSHNSFIEELRTVLSNVENAYINPERFKTFHPIDKVTNLTSIHISNYHESKKIFGKFDIITMQNSNDMMVKHGLTFGICGTLKYISPVGEFRYNGYMKDNKLSGMMKELGAKHVYFGWTEGSYYQQELFEEISIPISKHGVYDRDEGSFQTALFAIHPELLDQVKPSYTLISPKIERHHIQEVLDGKHDGVYAVKRVVRDMNDPIRKYINQLC